MWRSMIREKVCVDDLHGARVEIASFEEPKEASRDVRIFDEENTPSFTKEEIDQFLAEYGAAYDQVIAEGLPPGAWGKGQGPSGSRML
jgi:hypothetical protein